MRAEIDGEQRSEVWYCLPHGEVLGGATGEPRRTAPRIFPDESFHAVAEPEDAEGMAVEVFERELPVAPRLVLGLFQNPHPFGL